MDTGLTDYTRMTDIRHSRVISDFNSNLLNLRVLKYKFWIVTIVPVGHILNLKKKLALYVQYNLSSILFKKTGTVSSVVDPFKSVRIRSLRKQYLGIY